MSAASLPPTASEPSLPAPGRAFVVGLIGVAIACVALLVPDMRPTFFRAWLVAFNVFTGISLGGMVILMLQYLTGGDWGFVLRRPLEAGVRTLPMLALLFVPIALGMSDLYVWARPEEVAASANLQWKQPYLNVPFFLARTAGYFVIWSVIGFLLTGWSRRMDTTKDVNTLHRCEALSAGGMVLYVVTVTFASIDWVMSLEPDWYSTIYGAMFGMGQVLSALVFGTAVLLLLASHPEVEKKLTQQNLRDLGSLTMAFVMIWAYLALSQFLLIWGGNLPEEIPWYVKRGEGIWSVMALALIFLHFVLPFVLLLNSSVKTRTTSLFRVAVLVLVMRAVDITWLIVPAFNTGHGSEGESHGNPLEAVIYVAAIVGVGGLWLGYYLMQLRQAPLIGVQVIDAKEAAHG